GINFVIGLINGFIDGLNHLHIDVGPVHVGLSIPHIPYLARGARNFTGLAVVGDAGPELVSLNNQNVYSNADSAAMLSGFGADVSPQPTASVGPGRPQRGNGTRPVTIIMEVNGRKFAKATIADFGPEMAKELRAVLG